MPPAPQIGNRRATKSTHVVRPGESRCVSIVDRGYTQHRLEPVEGYAQQREMTRVAPVSLERYLEQKRVIAREGIVRTRTV